MNSFKIQQLIKGLEDLQTHLSDSQGMDLKSRLDEMRNPIKKENPLSGMNEEEDEEKDPLDASKGGLLESSKPKGVAIEKISVMAKPKSYDDKVNDAISKTDDRKDAGKLMPGEEEMTDDELEELLKRFK